MADWNTDVNISPEHSLNEKGTFGTLISTGEGGTERRRSKRSVVRSTFTFTFNALTTDEIDAIWDFYVARLGAYEAWTWTRPARDLGDPPQLYTLRFKDDNLSREWFAANLHSTGFDVIEVL